MDVTTSCIIACSLERVEAYSADPDRVPEWYANIKSVEWLTPRPVQVGSRLAFVALFLGRRLAYTYEVCEWESGRRFVMKTAEGPFPMETTYTWEPVGAGTLMSLRNRGMPSGFSRWLAPFIAMAVRRANRRDLTRLSTILERPMEVS